MLPDRVSNPGPLTYDSCALPIALRGPAQDRCGTPYRSHGYVMLRFRGNVVMKMGTQQQHNNQDRYVNELVPPRTWTLLGSV